MTDQHDLAGAFAGMHRRGAPLLLPNAWDAASAVAVAREGAAAVATTSAGVAWATGIRDGADLGAARIAEVVRRITASVDVPVSADIEAGYESVADTVVSVVEAGAVGVNIEDRAGAGLATPAEQARRLASARAAADRLGVRAWINARTDVYLLGIGAPETRLGSTMERAHAYADAGADSIFVPGLIDLDAISELAAGPLPVAVMAFPGAPSVAEFTAAGAARVSLGSAIAQAAYAVAARATVELLAKGTYDSCADAIPYGEFNALFRA
jgi:2-methylisocitrate lyase-like PEP mutase family enzyme